jgi:hypothetical protein
VEGQVQAEAIHGGLGGGEVEFGRGGIQSRKSDKTSSSFLRARARRSDQANFWAAGGGPQEQSSDVEPNTATLVPVNYPPQHRYTFPPYSCNLQLYMSTR